MKPSVTSTVEIGGVALEVLHYPVQTAVRRSSVLLLHEGLGSAAQWKDFPRQLAERLGTDVIAYSRAGYGRSDAADWPWGAGFMHTEAEVLAELIRRLELADPPVLIGHSDGGSIALIAAACEDIELAGLVVMAPHVFVEDLTVASIEALGPLWANSDFRRPFSFYHRHAEELFEHWRRVWLSKEFRNWDLRPLLDDIEVPLLAMQGEQDEYGTMAQIDEIVRAVPKAQTLRLADCGHAPHRDQLEEVLEAIVSFVAGLSSG